VVEAEDGTGHSDCGKYHDFPQTFQTNAEIQGWIYSCGGPGKIKMWWPLSVKNLDYDFLFLLISCDN
jgi:hypothetical protein